MSAPPQFFFQGPDGVPIRPAGQLPDGHVGDQQRRQLRHPPGGHRVPLIVGALAQQPGKGLPGPQGADAILRPLLQQDHRLQRSRDVPADAGGPRIEHAADGPRIGPHQGAVAVDDLRPGIALPQGGLGAFADDGYTGTNFQRPAFQRMLRDIENGRIRCVLVKDLSRFGRDYIETGRYLERWLPEHGARFIAVTDNIDSDRGAYDMMMPLKNLFNTQYARDISQKVKSSLHAKQQRGEFIGAFASYGYCKDPQNHNRLVIDPPAAEVVRRIFTLFENGMGKIRIAKQLNEEGIPCPSEYKRLTGEKYRNNHRLASTTYWTYATIHRILQNEMYIGNMEQGRDDRLQMHGKAKRKDRSQWTVVSGTHQPIIEKDQWQRVQTLLNAHVRTPDFHQNVSPFAGFLKCGDCGRAMVKTTWGGKIFYACGSYKRYGASVCSKHYIAHDVVAKVVLDDLNRLMAAVENLRQLAQQGVAQRPSSNGDPPQKLEAALQRIQRRRQSAYEDYQDALISKEDFLRYRADYDAQEQALQVQLDKLRGSVQDDPLSLPWVKELLASGQLAELDRPTVAAAIREIRVYEGNHMEIDYLLPEGCRALLEG